MASLITVRLSKGDSPSLGFRLQGGKDFGTPLVIQKVNGGSPAERAGLLAGDSVIKVNNTDVFNLRHKDAQDVIVRAGPAFELTVQRGGSVWKPSVIPTGTIHSASPTSPITKTSLVANKKENIGSIGTGHNLSAKPFSAQLNGAVNGGPKLVNNQYNSPLKLYSEESIAETLSAQTEVLSTGALGVNFKKNEKNYDASNSAVYRMLQEAEKEPKTPEAEPDTAVVPSAITGLRHVSAPENRPPSSNPQLPPGQNICADCERLIVGVFVRIKDKNLHVECFKCSTCGTSLKNVGYYNINNKLYCDVHAKLAARTNPPAPNLVPITVPPGGKAPASAISTALATHSLPSPSPLSPKTNLAQPFQPSQDKETNLSTPLQNLSIYSDPNCLNKPNNLLSSATPLSYSKYLNKAGNYSTTPKPFASVSAPTSNQSYNTLPKTAPLSPIASAPAPASYSPVSSTGRSVQSIVWPPQPEEPEVPTACPLYVPPETHLRVIPKLLKREDCEYSDTTSDTKDSELEEINIMAQFQEPKLSLCSEEVSEITSGRRNAVECVETITESLETQRLVESVLKNRPPSPPPLDKDIVIPKVKKSSGSISCADCSQTNICLNKESCELKRLSEFKPNTVECKLNSQVENTVPQQWESPMVQALRTVPEGDPFKQIPKKHSSSALASALAIAPPEPFTAPMSTHLDPVPLPEETVPYFPPEHPILIEPKEPKPDKPESKFVKALQTAPERPFSPVGAAPVKKKKNPTDEFFKDLPKPQGKLSMREALTTASDRPYTPLSMENVKIEESCLKETKVEKQNLQKPLKPAILPTSFQKPLHEEKPKAPKAFPVKIYEKKEEREEEKQTDVKKSTTIEKHHTHSTTEESVENTEENTQQGMYPLFKGFSCSFENKSEHSQFKIEISTTPPIINTEQSQTPSVKISRTGESSESVTETVTEESKTREKLKQETKEKTIEKQAEQVVLKKPLPLAGTLHKPEALPQYQVSLSENVEADLQMMQKVEAARARHEQQKIVTAPPVKPPREIQIKPVITIQPGDSQLHQPEQSFKPVRDDLAPSSTFSPRPRPITPSMINKPPPTLPYYQANLVAQQYKAADVNLLDPTSPAISRSPSPCPDRRRSPSPFRAAATAAAAAVRAKSPAAGPPPNPLKSSKPLPTLRDTKIEEAKKSVASYIPQYQSKMDVVEKAQIAPQMYSAYAETQKEQVDLAQRYMMREHRQVEDAMRTQVMSQQFAQGTASTAIREQSHSDHLEQMKKSEAQSVETLSGGQIQVQRKKTVTEEFERSQKSKTVEIERNDSTTKTHPFRDVKNPQIEAQGIIGLHVTNPQPLSSPFLKQTPPCAKSQTPPQCTKSCPLPLQQCPRAPVKQVPAPSTASPIKHVSAPSGSAQKPSVNKSNIPVTRAGAGSGGGRQAGAIGVAPKRGRGVLNTAALGGTRIPLCASCHSQIRGPFITALGKIWCPEHFICATPSCRRPLQDLGFVEEQGQLYCEYCFEQYLAPPCAKCASKIKGDCLKAIGKNFHPECFNCVYCGKHFGNSPFFLEDGNPYCEADWNELFTTKCFACGFPVEAGDRWVEALNNNYHSQCFNCTMCKKNLEGQSFFAKGGRPFCKNHAR